jgi:hypothetical protein
MVTKSLPTFKHTSIGAKTHKANTAKAHMSYIMRSEAMTKFQAENMPDGGRGTRAYFDKLWEKAGMPDNARIADKLMLALPIELNQEQRYELVASFMRELGQGRIAWCATHHDAGEDAHNPHAHILFKDADISTGRKVVGTTTNSRDVREAKKNGWKVPPRTTTADLRKRWCDHLNGFMEREGLDIRYDPRTLKQQGIDRKPQIHIGPKAEALHKKGHEFGSGDYHRGQRTIPYSMLDQDSRAQHNAEIIEFNKRNERAAAKREETARQFKPNPAKDREQRELREAQDRARRAMYQEQQHDRDAQRQAQTAERQKHQHWARQLYADAREKAFQEIRKQYVEKWRDLRAGGQGSNRAQAATELKREQQKSYQRESALQIDRRRAEKDKAWKTMQVQQEKDRLALRATHRDETSTLARQHAAERLVLEEKWRAQDLARQANRLDARLTAHQGMAAQQTAAVATIRLHRRASQTKSADGPRAIPVNPQEAVKHHLATARQEQQKLSLLRSRLTLQRTENIHRAAAAPVRANAGGRPRKHAPRYPANEDTRASLQQAVQSGRPLTDAERTNAAPDVKERLDRQDRKEASRWLFSNASDQGQRRDKGRPGGGRGR